MALRAILAGLVMIWGGVVTARAQDDPAVQQIYLNSKDYWPRRVVVTGEVMAPVVRDGRQIGTIQLQGGDEVEFLGYAGGRVRLRHEGGEFDAPVERTDFPRRARAAYIRAGKLTEPAEDPQKPAEDGSGQKAAVAAPSSDMEPEEPAGGIPPSGPGAVPTREVVTGDAALDAVRFPAQPDKVALRKYVLEILKLSARKKSGSSLDPEILKLEAVGSEHLDVLLDTPPGSGTSAFYLKCAMTKLVNADNRDQVLSRLKARPELISLVANRGWDAELRPLVEEYLKGGAGSGERQTYWWGWLTVAGRLQDPAVDKLLLEHLNGLENAASAIREIRQVRPDLDITEVVNRQWRRVYSPRTKDSWETRSLAVYAAETGNTAALKVLASMMEGPNRHEAELAMKALLALTDAPADPAAAAKWVATNFARLQWDPAVRRYTVRK